MNFLVRIIQQISIGKPFWVAGLVLPILMLSILGMFRIDFEDGLRSMFTADSAAFHNYAELTKSFAQNETDIAVLVQSDKPLDGRSLSLIENYILDAQFIDGVNGVYSIFSLTSFDAASGGRKRLFPANFEDTAALDKAIKSVAQNTASGISLISKDRQSTVIAFSITTVMSDIAGSTNTLHELQALTKEKSNAGDLEFSVTGLIPVREEIIAGLKRDQLKVNVLGALAGFLVSLVLFRSFWVALLNTITPVAALIFCLGSFGWFGLSINALTNALPVLILVLASADSIHLTFEIRRRMGRGEALKAAITHAVADIASPVVLTSLTTILAFASLFYSDSEIVKDLATAGTVSVFMAMTVVLFVHPVVFMIAGSVPRVLAALPVVDTSDTKRTGGTPLRIIMRNYRKIAIGGFVVCAVSLSVLWPVQPEYRFLENIDEGHEVVQTLKQVEALSGPINSINIPVKLKQGFDLSSPAVFDDLTNVHIQLDSVDEIRAVVSLHSVRNSISDANGKVDPLAFQEFIERMPERFRKRLLNDNGIDLQITALVPDEGSQKTAALVEAIDGKLRSLDLPTMTIANPTGFLVMSSSLSSEMIRQLTISFLIAALLCPALIGIWFRRLDFGLAAIVPNILPIIVGGAALTLLDYDIQITSALALTIAFGIALDDSIHVFNRLKLQMLQNDEPLSVGLISAAMSKVGPILVVTTFILAAGLLATSVSEMPMIRFFGALCITTFFLALVSDIVLLPAIIAWFGKRQRAK